MKTKIVVDSAANLYALEGVDFACVPLKIITDHEEYRDDGTLDAVEMATTLRTYKGKTSTSCPNVSDWLAAYEGAEQVFVTDAGETGLTAGEVVDADDWVDMPSIDTLMGTLRVQRVATDPVDMIVTNYVYDKVGKRVKHTVNFRHAMAANTVLGWDDLGCFGVAEYILMHALIYRTQVVRDSGMQLPEHTFYVDFYYSYQPFPWVKRIQYLDVPFYHYFIGREGQSVQTDVMIKRVDQLRLVNRLMTEATPERGTVPEGLYRYMIHFLAIESCVTSTFLILSRDPANYVKKTELWDAIDAYSPAIGKDVRSQLMSRALNLPGKTGRWIVRNGYLIAERIVGFN